MVPNYIYLWWFSIKHSIKVRLGECLTSYAKETGKNKKKVRLMSNQVPVIVYMQSNWLD